MWNVLLIVVFLLDIVVLLYDIVIGTQLIIALKKKNRGKN